MLLELEPVVEGNVAGPTLVFVQGWPDDASLWDRVVEKLSARYRCVRVTLPNYDGTKAVRWGHGSEEIIEALARAVRETSPDTPVTLVVHDWGSFWGHAMHARHPELAERIACLDVAPQVEPGLGAMLGIILYQGWLALAFFLGGPIGDWMTRAFAGAIGAPLRREQINAWMNYPYRNVWQDIFAGRARKYFEDYWPEMPLLFVYGKGKPFPFHSEKWVEHVERVGGEVVGLDCGHWVSEDPAFDEILVRWLRETDTKST